MPVEAAPLHVGEEVMIVPGPRLPCDDQGGRADRAQLVVLACQYGLAALPARDDEITSSTRARQSSR